VQELIDKTNYQDAIAKWGEAAVAGDADNPPSELTKPHDEASLRSSDVPSTSFGHGSSEGSGPQGKILSSISTSGLDTPATSPVTLSAV
jgi:hypothetical protein